MTDNNDCSARTEPDEPERTYTEAQVREAWDASFEGEAAVMADRRRLDRAIACLREASDE